MGTEQGTVVVGAAVAVLHIQTSAKRQAQHCQAQWPIALSKWHFRSSNSPFEQVINYDSSEMYNERLRVALLAC